jgi:hypothetical protein
MSEKNKRRDPRIATVVDAPVPMMLPVFYQVFGPDGMALDPEIRTAMIRDLSQSGMCLQIRHVPEVLAGNLKPGGHEGLRMALDLALPEKRLRVVTRLAWIKRTPEIAPDAVQVGLEFMDLSEAHRAEIVRFAKSLARRPHIQRVVVATLAALVIVGAATLWWSMRARERERAVLTNELVETSEQLTHRENEYRETANALEEQTRELNELAERLRAVGMTKGKQEQAPDGSGETAIETIRTSLAGVRKRIKSLEKEILPDGECVPTDRCGDLECCTWKDGACLCDNCCVNEPQQLEP